MALPANAPTKTLAPLRLAPPPAPSPMIVLLVPVVKASPASIPNTVFPCGLPLKPGGTSPTYKLFVSTKQSVRPFNEVAPPPPAAANVILPVPELNVNTSPFDAPDCKPGILNAVMFASPRVISLLTLAELASAALPITILF